MSTELNNTELSLNEKAIFSHGKVTNLENRPIINGEVNSIGEVCPSEGLGNKATAILGSVKEKIETAFDNVKSVFTKKEETLEEKFEGVRKDL